MLLLCTIKRNATLVIEWMDYIRIIFVWKVTWRYYLIFIRRGYCGSSRTCPWNKNKNVKDTFIQVALFFLTATRGSHFNTQMIQAKWRWIHLCLHTRINTSNGVDIHFFVVRRAVCVQLHGNGISSGGHSF